VINSPTKKVPFICLQVSRTVSSDHQLTLFLLDKGRLEACCNKNDVFWRPYINTMAQQCLRSPQGFPMFFSGEVALRLNRQQKRLEVESFVVDLDFRELNVRGGLRSEQLLDLFLTYIDSDLPQSDRFEFILETLKTFETTRVPRHDEIWVRILILVTLLWGRGINVYVFPGLETDIFAEKSVWFEFETDILTGQSVWFDFETAQVLPYDLKNPKTGEGTDLSCTSAFLLKSVLKSPNKIPQHHRPVPPGLWIEIGDALFAYIQYCHW
jgi:hypothetical protein